MSHRTLALSFAVLLVSTSAFSLDEASHRSEPLPTAGSRLEQRLIWSLMDVRAGRLDDALKHVDRLLEAQPDFALAHLVRGDVLSALRQPLAAFGASQTLGAEIHGLRDEARARLKRFLRLPPSRTVPADLVLLAPSVQHALLVDTENYRLYVFGLEEGVLVRQADYYVSIGKGGNDKRYEGDEKTPTGLYRVASYLPGDSLPDLYGKGAFPIDYPNGWDRLHGRTGSGIWIHGTESTRYSRPPLSSLGCVTLSNEDFADLEARVEVGSTPVVLSRGVRWVSADSVTAVGASVRSALEAWRRDWESRDTERYLSHYSGSFRTQGMNRQAFAAHKRRVNGSKRFIKVELRDLAIYGYPGEPAMVAVEFLQHYRSDSFQAQKRKRQYWRFESGRWQIAYEG